MKITKRNGSITVYDDEKVKNSILKANALITGETISDNMAEAMANEVLDRLTQDDVNLSTADVRACVYGLLKERDFPLTAEEYWTYKKDQH